MDQPEDISRLIGAIYEAALCTELWPGVLRSMCSFVGGAGAMIFWQDAALKTGKRFCSWGDDPDYTQSYFDTYVALSPITALQPLQQVGKVVLASSLIDHDTLCASRFYQEWMEPQDYLDNVFASLDRSASSHASIGIARSVREGHGDAQSIARLSLLVPHIGRAIKVSNLIGNDTNGFSGMRRLFDQLGTCIFVIDAAGVVEEVNQAARALLDEHDLLVIAGGKLRAADWQNSAVSNFMAPRTGGEVGQSRTNSQTLCGRGGASYIASWLLMTSGASTTLFGRSHASRALLVKKVGFATKSAVDALAVGYRLTLREAEVMLALVEIGGVPQVANVLGISTRTAKSHLQSIFAKTGVDRQVDLVKLLAGFGPLDLAGPVKLQKANIELNTQTSRSSIALGP